MRPRPLNVLGAAALFFGLLGMIEAQIVWSGTTSTFILGSNWVGGNDPGPTDIAQFGNHGGQSTIVVNSTTVGHLDFLATRTVVHNFLYTDGVATLTLNGNFTAAAGPDINFINTTNQLNLALPSGEHVFDIGGSTNVLIMGVVSGAGHLSKVGTGTLVLTGANTLNWNGVGSFNNGIAVDGGTLEINAGTITQSFNDIIVGSVNGGTGTLLVSNGGDVSAKYGVAGNDSSTNGTITVTGAGSTWTNSDGMALGYLGSGTLNVLAGGTVNTTGSGSDHSYLGLQAGTTGTATVSGTGSAWTTPNDQLIIGGGGGGNLTVSAGGLVTNTAGYVGLDATGSGTVAVNSGTWTNSAELVVGNSGAGTLAISNGGDVTNTYSYVATQSGSNGSVTVDGAGSTWTNSGLLAVGQGGTGSLAITGGGMVASTEGYVGYAAGSNGTATVTGAGSAWTTSANLTVGNSGTGVLTLADSGKVNVNSGTGTLVLGDSSGSNGTVNIGATAVNTAAAGGIVNATSIATGAGIGTLQFNITDAQYYLTHDGTAGGAPVVITGSTQLIQTAGGTILTGNNSYTGGTFINGGYLTLGDNGTTGSITGNVTFGGNTDVGGGELAFQRSNSYTFAGNISGPGRVTNSGTGTTTLTGSNTYSGDTFIWSGALADGTGGAFSAQSAMRINTGAALLVNHNETIAGLGDYTAGVAGSVSIAPGASLTLDSEALTRTFSGIISGDGGLVKAGSHTQVLSGANTYTGHTFINGGYLTLGDNGTTGSITGNVTFGGNTDVGGGELAFQRSNPYTFAGNISGPGRVTNSGTGTTTLTGSNTYSGDTFIWSGALADGTGGAFSAQSTMRINTGAALVVNHNETIAGLGDYSAGVGGTVNVASGVTLTLNTGGATTFTGDIGSAGSLFKNGAGTQILAGANTYAGGTHVAAGTLQLTGSITHGATDFLVNGSGGTNPSLQITDGGDLTVDRLRLGITNSTFTGNASVNGGGSTVTANNYLYVGEAGSGQLSILNGGTVTSLNTSIGNNTGGDGGAIVTGAGSTLSNTGTLYVGSAGSGYLEITNQGLAISATGVVGNNPGGSGDVYLDTGGTWATAGTLTVGNGSGGDIAAFGGSTVTANTAIIGALGGVFGSVSIHDSGTTFGTSSNLVVGNNGDGQLEIGNGADAATGGLATLGNPAGSSGWAFVNGAGSTWTVAGGLTLGGSGYGEVHVTDSAHLIVGGGGGTVTLGANTGATGHLLLGVFNGEGGSNAGVLNAALITTGGGLGKVHFEPYGSTKANPFYLTGDGTPGGTPVIIAGTTLVEHNFGYTVLSGGSSYSGGTTINAGTLVAAHDSALGTGSVVINGGTLALGSGVTFNNLIGFGVNGGKLAGEGTFTGPLTLGSGVKLAPGSSPGTMNFGSSLTLNNGGSLEIEIRAPSGTPGTDWDFVSITGAFNLGSLTAGGYSLKVISLDLANNPGAVSGLTGPTAWVIATAGDGITGFEAADFAIDFSQFVGGGNFVLSSTTNDLVLSFTPVPEPSTYALMISGLALAGLAHRRRKNLARRR